MTPAPAAPPPSVLLASLALGGAILCSVTIAVLLRRVEERRGNRLVVIAANYLTAVAGSLLAWGLEGFPAVGAFTGGLGLLGGVVFIGTFLLMTAAIGRVGIAIPVSVTRLAVVVPILVSMVGYGETPDRFGAAGLFLALVALALFGAAVAARAGEGSKRAPGRRRAVLGAWVPVVGLFLAMGTVEVVLKVFKENRPAGAPYQPFGFLLVIFGTALVIAWTSVRWKGSAVKRPDLLTGLALGVPNILSTVFFLYALRGLPGIVAFPVNAMSIIVLSTAAGIVIWREHPTRGGWAALACAVLSIVCINFSGR